MRILLTTIIFDCCLFVSSTPSDLWGISCGCTPIRDHEPHCRVLPEMPNLDDRGISSEEIVEDVTDSLDPSLACFV